MSKQTIRTLIVDDEPLAREGLRLLLTNEPQIDIVGECSTGREAVTAIRSLAPDLLFLDIQMPEVNGFEALSQVPAEQLPTVVFVTAYDQYALRAFEARALDYLLKPFSDERFYKTLARAKDQVEQQRAKKENGNLQALLAEYQQRRPAPKDPAAPATAPALGRLMIKSAGRIVFINADEIDWIEAADYYVLLHVGSKSHLLRETMAELEAKLDPQKFLRIHRSTVVNVERVRELQAQNSGDYTVRLGDGTALKLSRRRREALHRLVKRLTP